MLDLDNFKQVNDRHGHQVGDEALSACSESIRESVREIDVPCRYEGEECALILPATDRTGAFIVSERIRSDVEERFRTRAVRNHRFDLSVGGGLSIYPIDSSTEEELVNMADKALYRSKREGKNRITLHPDEKRNFPRFEAKKTLVLRIAEAGELASHTKNLSQSGALVESQIPMSVGMELEVVIRRSDKTSTFKGRVVRIEEVEQEKDKRYEVLFAFLAEGEEQARQLESLTQELYPALN